MQFIASGPQTDHYPIILYSTAPADRLNLQHGSESHIKHEWQEVRNLFVEFYRSLSCFRARSVGDKLRGTPLFDAIFYETGDYTATLE